MQANFQLLTGDSAIGGGLQLPVTQSWTADNIVLALRPILAARMTYVQYSEENLFLGGGTNF